MNTQSEHSQYYHAGIEPALDDMIHDAVIQTMMARDGVEESKLMPLLKRAHARVSRATHASRNAAAA
ncbi:MAG: hypothetical protein IT567_02880 [Alphaproteobacteria bacterium]|nr:hypothetical protein [Alphaproteobacteria bacterium]